MAPSRTKIDLRQNFQLERLLVPDFPTRKGPSNKDLCSSSRTMRIYHSLAWTIYEIGLLPRTDFQISTFMRSKSPSRVCTHKFSANRLSPRSRLYSFRHCLLSSKYGDLPDFSFLDETRQLLIPQMGTIQTNLLELTTRSSNEALVLILEVLSTCIDVDADSSKSLVPQFSELILNLLKNKR